MEVQGPKKHKGGYKQINKALNICAFEDYLEKQHSRLPDLADVEQLSPRVLRVLGQNAGKASRGTQIPHTTILDLDFNGIFKPVHSPRHKHIHSRHRCPQTNHRYWPRHPRVGRSDLQHAVLSQCLPVTCIAHALARGSYRRSTGPSTAISKFITLDLQAHTLNYPATHH